MKGTGGQLVTVAFVGSNHGTRAFKSEALTPAAEVRFTPHRENIPAQGLFKLVYRPPGPQISSLLVPQGASVFILEILQIFSLLFLRLVPLL